MSATKYHPNIDEGHQSGQITGFIYRDMPPTRLEKVHFSSCTSFVLSRTAHEYLRTPVTESTFMSETEVVAKQQFKSLK